MKKYPINQGLYELFVDVSCQAKWNIIINHWQNCTKKTAQCGHKAEEKVVEATAVSILWGTQYVHIVVVPANEALNSSKISPNRCSRLGTDVFLLQLKSDQELCLYHVYACVKRPWRGVSSKSCSPMLVLLRSQKNGRKVSVPMDASPHST